MSRRRETAVPLAQFRLSVLGRLQLTGPDGPVDLPNKKLAGLLAYLACTAPVAQSRERLATLLWGSHFETQAQQNLRQAMGLAELGRFGEAATHEAEAIRIATTTQHAFPVGWTDMAAGVLHLLRGDWARAHPIIEQATQS